MMKILENLRYYLRLAYSICIILFFIFFLSNNVVFSQAQSSRIVGEVMDKSTGEPLLGVYISVKDKMQGTVTDNTGKFELNLKIAPPFSLVISYLGYSNQEINISNKFTEISIQLEEEAILGQEVVVSASRIEQSILSSPVTIEKLTALDFQQISSANFYDGLATIKGVDMSIHSLIFRYPNTRGFTSESNYRMNQLIDGVDNTPPGLSFSAGNIFGVSPLDIKNVELLVGASSALYGPGGMNGTLIMNTKDPYEYDGLSYSIQGGIMHVNADYMSNPKPMGDFNFRYAHSYRDKLGIKITLGYLDATDWHASDYHDKNNLDNESLNRYNYSGYDGVNVYGDDVIRPVNLRYDVAPTVAAQLGYTEGTPDYDTIINAFPDAIVTRTGWKEDQLADDHTTNLRAGLAIYYRFGKDYEAIVSGNYANGSSVYTAQNRFALRNFEIVSPRIEIKNPVFYFRAYADLESSGDTYDIGGAALQLNEAWKPSEEWYEDYVTSYAQDCLMGFYDLETCDRNARTYADNRDQNGNIQDHTKPALPVPGTPYFDSLYNSIISTPVNQGGAMVIDKSKMMHFEGMYNLNKMIKFVDIMIGASYRKYWIDSQGTIFFDKPGNPIEINQYGAFLQMIKKMLGDHLNVTGSVRYDKNEYFKGRFTPRASLVYSFSSEDKHNIRASAQTAFRFPSISDQWINLAVGPYQLIGGQEEVQNYYNFDEIPVYPLTGSNPITGEIDTTNGPYKIPEFRPERVTAYEVGYKGLLYDKRLLIDAYVYLNNYNGFMATQLLGQYTATDTLKFKTTVSTDQPVKSYGMALGIDYRIFMGFMLKFNFSYNALGKIENMPTGFQANFNTPRYRINLSVGNRNITRNLGFNLTYRLQEHFLWQSTFGDAEMPSYSTLDGHISVWLPKISSTIKIGGSNLLNNYYTTNFGSAQIGALYYITFVYSHI